MEDLPPSTIERVGCAVTSGNLKMKETVTDIDYVMALGMVGSQNHLASTLIHVRLAGSLVSFKAARRATYTLTERLSEARDWKLPAQKILRVADAALKMYLDPVCPKCNGVKYKVAPGTPFLTDRPCEKCRGTGRRNYPMLDGRKVSEVVHVLSSIEDVAEVAIRRKMRQR